MTDSGDKAQALIDWIDGNSEELVDLLASVLRIKSVYPEGAYGDVVAFLEDAHKRAGVTTTRVSAPEERVVAAGKSYPRPNLVSLLGDGQQPVLMIGTHLDVVDAQEPEWEVDPFGGVVKDGRIYGRGAVDAKATLAAQVFAARALVACGVELEGTLMMVASVDDEGRVDNLQWPGTAFLAEGGLEEAGLPLPDMVINGECSGLQQISGSFKGRLIVDIFLQSDTSHIAAPGQMSSIDSAANLIGRLKEIPLGSHELQGDEAFRVFAIEGNTKMCKVQAEFRSVSGGGTARMRTDVERVLAELAAAVPNLKVEPVYLSEREPFETPEDHKLVETIRVAAQRVGIDAKYAPVIGAGELQPFLDKGIPGVTYGPGLVALAHGPNEYVEVAELVKQTQIYALAALELVGTAETN